MMAINLKNTAILNVNGTHYHCIVNRICKSDAVNLLENAALTEKRGVLKK